MKRRFSALILLLAVTVLLSGCGDTGKGMPVGSGTPGVTEKIDWRSYDDLLKAAQDETDPHARSLLLHQAEDMLMATGCVVPLYTMPTYYLCKPYIGNLFMDSMGNIKFTHITRLDGKNDEPVRMSICAEPTNLDPASDPTTDVLDLGSALFATLLKTTENGLAPDLAESYEVSEDGCTYTFHMREGLVWSDGSKLDATDMEYTWKRNLSLETAASMRELLSMVDGFDSEEPAVWSEEDGRLFKVRLSSPCMYFPALCAFPFFGVVQQEAVESAPGYRDEDGSIVGPRAWGCEAGVPCCGPYTIESWEHEVSIVLKKNPCYYDADSITVETIELMLTTDVLSRYTAYTVGDLDVLLEGIPGDVISSMIGNPELHFHSMPISQYVAFNVGSDLFAGMTFEEAATFRHAFSLAIDRSFLAAITQGGICEALTTFVPTTMSDGTGRPFGDPDSSSPYPYENGYLPVQGDPEGARELLRSIGFEFGSDGKLKDPVALEFVHSGGTSDAIAACLQADLAKIGIQLIPRTLEGAMLWDEGVSGHFEMCCSAWVADFDDPYSFLSLFSGSSINDLCCFGE